MSKNSLDQADTSTTLTEDNIEQKLTELASIMAKLSAGLEKQQKKLSRREKEREALLLRKHTHFFRIHCTPDTPDRTAHRIGLFSTSDNAQQYIPPSGASQRDGVVWSYSVKTYPSSEPCPIEELDKRPFAFPYTDD